MPSVPTEICLNSPGHQGTHLHQVVLFAASGPECLNSLINITLQGRHDTYPKRRGLTRVLELMAFDVGDLSLKRERQLYLERA
jgi:hypothetical protein